MELISSRANEKVKQARALRERKHRQESGLFLIEGIHHVGEAVAAARVSKLSLSAIYYAPDLLKSEFAQRLIAEQAAEGVPCYALTAEVFQSIADKENPQGILAIARARQYQLDELHPGNFPWGVALVAPQDPGNIGAILRTIDAVAASGMLLLESSADPYHPACVRASMGALFWYPLVSTSFDAFARWAQKHGYHIYGTSAHAAVDYRQVAVYEKPLILLMGSERQGLTPQQAAVCHHFLRMPMRGRVTSLNLAVAAGVMLYTILDRLA
jgi:TrmH family RNA methyltransferase